MSREDKSVFKNFLAYIFGGVDHFNFDDFPNNESFMDDTENLRNDSRKIFKDINNVIGRE